MGPSGLGYSRAYTLPEIRHAVCASLAACSSSELGSGLPFFIVCLEKRNTDEALAVARGRNFAFSNGVYIILSTSAIASNCSNFGWSSALHREMAHCCERRTWFQGAATAYIWVLVGRELRSMRAVVRVGDIALAGARCSASLTLDLTRYQAMRAIADSVCKAPHAIIGSF